MLTFDANKLHYRQLNEHIKKVFINGNQELAVKNVNGQRYIGAGICGNQKLLIEGTPGNDLACYMNGLEIIVNGNCQDGAGNTMNRGSLIIDGNAGDVAGYAMRGGKIFIKGNVGYRAGIHMKAFKKIEPVIVVGGKAGDFFGEYMAGGKIILLGIDIEKDEIVGNYCGTGMHGGVIYVRGEISEYKLGREIKQTNLTKEDEELIYKYVKRFTKYFNIDSDDILNKPFKKLIPVDKRPYGKLYTAY
jgi:glutamate synthase domain-containing protein 3